MEPSIYTTLKVNNEVEACRVYDLETKQTIENFLLKNGISYFIKWEKPRLFSKRQESCIICINENNIDAFAKLMASVSQETKEGIDLLMQPSKNDFL